MPSDRSPAAPLASVTLVIAAVAGVLPAGALGANNCQGAPGTSAVEQYCEAILSADGDRQRPAKPVAKADRAAASAALPPLLRKAGKEGRAIARLVPAGTLERRAEQASDRRTERKQRSSKASGETTAVATAAVVDDGSDSLVAAAAHAIGSVPSAQPTLAWSVIGLTGLAAAGGVRRRRIRATGATS